MIKEYKANNKTFIKYSMLINGFFLVLFIVLTTIFISIDFWTIVFFFFVVNTAILYNFSKSPISISLNEGTRMICLTYRLKSKQCLKIDDIESLLNLEMTSGTSKAKVFRLLKDSSSIVKIIPENTGWSEKDLEQIHESLTTFKSNK